MDVATAAGDLRWWAVALAALSMFVLGGAWYGAVFAQRWQVLNELSDEEVARNTGRVFAVAGAASIVICVVLALFIGSGAGGAAGAVAGLLAGLGWLAPGLAMTYAFERRPNGLLAIDAGYHVVAFTVAGAMVGWLA